MDEYRDQRNSKNAFAWRYNTTTSFDGWKDLQAQLISFSGTDDPELSHLPGADDSQYATMALAGSAIYFAHNVPECVNASVTTSLQDLIDIYRGNLKWRDLYIRHPIENSCLQFVHRPITAYHRSQPCGSNYIVQNAFHSLNSTTWPWRPSLTWMTNETNPAGLVIPRNDYMQQVVARTYYSLGYMPFSTTVKGFVVHPIKMWNNGGGAPVEPTSDAIQRNAHFDDQHINITCAGCWPLMGYGYFVIPRATVIAKSQQLLPLTLRSCLNLRGIADFFLWTLTTSSSHRANGFFTPISEVKKEDVRQQLATLTCNGKNVLTTNWAHTINATNLALFILLPSLTLIAILVLGIVFVNWRERRNVSNIKHLSQLGAIEDEVGYNAYLMDHIDGTEMESINPRAPTSSATTQLHSSSSSISPSSDATMVTLDSSGSGSQISKSSTISTASDESLAKILVPFTELTIGTVIGSGSFGEVYTGVYKHRVVAIKRIASSRDSHLIASFLQEARAMVSIDHPNILRLLAISIKNPYTYIVSEYCKYGSLEDYLKSHPEKATIQHKLDLMTQAARGVAYLHSKNMTHRDLKPSNLLMNEQGVVKVGDLGTATSQNTHKTMVGTLDFSAPEVLDGQVYTNSCDVYSFAICLWSLFSDQPLYPGWTMYDIIMKVVPGARPPITAISSPKLAKLITACWDSNPSLRPSFTAILKDLSSIDASDFNANHI